MSGSQVIVELNKQPIELCKLLKIANLVSGGGEAKIVISEGYVFLNGNVEYQKRKKIYHNDIIEFNGDSIQVEINEALGIQEDEQTLNTTVPTNKNKEPLAEHTNKKSPTESIINDSQEQPKERKRRPISF